MDNYIAKGLAVTFGVLLLVALLMWMFLDATTQTATPTPTPKVEPETAIIDWYPVWDHGMMCYSLRPLWDSTPLALSCVPVDWIPGADNLWPNWREWVRPIPWDQLPEGATSIPGFDFHGVGTVIPGPTVVPNGD